MHDNVTPLSQLSDYEVADDSVDVRGWTVVTTAGAEVGRVNDLVVDSTTMKARYLAVALEDSGSAATDGDATLPVLLPVDRAQIDEDARRVLVDGSGDNLSQMPRYGAMGTSGEHSSSSSHTEVAAASNPARSTEAGPHRITRSAEELRVGKRSVEAGEVTVRKHVETEHVTEPVTRSREIVNIERRPVAADAGGAAEIREDEIRVPLVEEEIVVEKRPVVKEELVITKERVTETENVEVDLREERIEVDGVNEKSTTTRRES
jgi:uncharacterized protein (TIGR02271 family)